MKIDTHLTAADLRQSLTRFWETSAAKIGAINADYDSANGSPVFTVDGKYTTRGWTEWTQGFQYGAEILQFDATGQTAFLDSGRNHTLHCMAPHLTHIGVHDHGFNNVSTYGNLRRLMREGKIPHNEWEFNFYELALKVTGAVQATRWTEHRNGGFIHSFNGPHSLFVDTIRSCRALSLSHLLGHTLCSENDRRHNLLERMLQHARSTAAYSVYYGEGRDSYDCRGRTAHESIFNTTDGNYRCPNTQQGFSGFSTWTRGLAWAMLGFTEELEFIAGLDDSELEPFGGRREIEGFMLKAARATCDFYIANSAADGIPYWDTGAPNLHRLPDNYLEQPADPFNSFEPVDSSAAAIGAQGLLRLGHILRQRNEQSAGDRYWQAGLTTVRTLLDEPYLSTKPAHQGLILHSIYHQPNGWDHVPEGRKIACGEASMWGDYHARETALYLQRIIDDEPYYTFFA